MFCKQYYLGYNDKDKDICLFSTVGSYHQLFFVPGKVVFIVHNPWVQRLPVLKRHRSFPSVLIDNFLKSISILEDAS